MGTAVLYQTMMICFLSILPRYLSALASQVGKSVQEHILSLLNFGDPTPRIGGMSLNLLLGTIGQRLGNRPHSIMVISDTLPHRGLVVQLMSSLASNPLGAYLGIWTPCLATSVL